MRTPRTGQAQCAGSPTSRMPRRTSSRTATTRRGNRSGSTSNWRRAKTTTRAGRGRHPKRELAVPTLTRRSQPKGDAGPVDLGACLPACCSLRSLRAGDGCGGTRCRRGGYPDQASYRLCGPGRARWRAGCRWCWADIDTGEAPHSEAPGARRRCPIRDSSRAHTPPQRQSGRSRCGGQPVMQLGPHYVLLHATTGWATVAPVASVAGATVAGRIR